MVEKHLIGLAGEYAVASEICRRGMNAVVTLGKRKSVDIIVEDESLARLIQVKTKTGREWPGVKGVKGDNILILVDFQKRKLMERADFYIFNAEDWENFQSERIKFYEKKYGVNSFKVRDDGVLIWPAKTEGKSAYVGIGILAENVADFKENWDKIFERS